MAVLLPESEWMVRKPPDTGRCDGLLAELRDKGNVAAYNRDAMGTRKEKRLKINTIEKLKIVPNGN